MEISKVLLDVRSCAKMRLHYHAIRVVAPWPALSQTELLIQLPFMESIVKGGGNSVYGFEGEVKCHSGKRM